VAAVSFAAGPASISHQLRSLQGEGLLTNWELKHELRQQMWGDWTMCVTPGLHCLLMLSCVLLQAVAPQGSWHCLLGASGSEHSLSPPALSDIEVLSQAFIFIFAGYEPTSNTLGYLAYQLALHPDVQQKVVNEIDTILPNKVRECQMTAKTFCPCCPPNSVRTTTLALKHPPLGYSKSSKAHTDSSAL